jgi:hypothetical protein
MQRNQRAAGTPHTRRSSTATSFEVFISALKDTMGGLGRDLFFLFLFAGHKLLGICPRGSDRHPPCNKNSTHLIYTRINTHSNAYALPARSSARTHTKNRQKNDIHPSLVSSASAFWECGRCVLAARAVQGDLCTAPPPCGSATPVSAGALRGGSPAHQRPTGTPHSARN